MARLVDPKDLFWESNIQVMVRAGHVASRLATERAALETFQGATVDLISASEILRAQIKAMSQDNTTGEGNAAA